MNRPFIYFYRVPRRALMVPEFRADKSPNLFFTGHSRSLSKGLEQKPGPSKVERRLNRLQQIRAIVMGLPLLHPCLLPNHKNLVFWRWCYITLLLNSYLKFSIFCGWGWWVKVILLFQIEIKNLILIIMWLFFLTICQDVTLLSLFFSVKTYDLP